MRESSVRRLFAAVAAIGVFLSSAVARAGFDAEILSAHASPDPVAAGQTTMLSAQILNTSTLDSGYNGTATFVVQFLIDPPGTSTDYQCDGSFEFQYDEWKIISCRYTTGSAHVGIHSVEVKVLSPSEWRTWDSTSFTFLATNPDPCAGRSCPDSCDGSDILTNGSCQNENGRAVCAYTYRIDCHQNDSGQSERYCEGNDSYSRSRETTYTCRSGSCVGSTSTSNRQYITTCGNTCDGNVRVLGKSCSSGLCVGGFRTDCDAYDRTTTSRYCNGNEVWERRQTADFSCRNADCSERNSESAYGMKSCGFGCDPAINDCRRDPCAGFACPDKCEGDLLRYNSSCINSNGVASCIYASAENCSERLPEETVLWRACGSNGHPVATRQRRSWICSSDNCISGAGTIFKVDEGACAVEDRCYEPEGQCSRCRSVWSCTDWSPCTGVPYQTRTCTDAGSCPLNERPVERGAACACRITDIEWQDANGNPISAAVDSERVRIAMSHYGHCSDTCVTAEIWNRNWTIIPDNDPRGSDRFQPSFCFGHDGALTTQEWIATFSKDGDWWGFNNFYVRITELDFESGNILEVRPKTGSLGDLSTLLQSHLPTPLTPADDVDCLREQFQTVTVTDRCLAVWEMSGLMNDDNTRRYQEGFENFLEFFIGSSIGEFAYFLVCTFCGVGTVAATAACPVTGGTCLVLPAALACDYGCLNFLGRYFARVALFVWKSALVRSVVQKAESYLTRGFHPVTTTTNSLREDLVHQTVRAADDSTVDLIVAPGRSDPETIYTLEVKNFLGHEIGWDEFGLVNLGLQRRYGTSTILFNLANGAGNIELSKAERALFARLFADGNMDTFLGHTLEDLSGTGNANPFHILKSITFIPRTTSGDTRVFGRTRPVDGGLNIIEISLRDTLERFRNYATALIRSFTLPHEIGHAAASTQVRRIGYQLRPVGESAEAAVEYLNDVYVLRHLRSTATARRSDEYAQMKALDMIGVFLESDGVTATSVVESKVDEFVNDLSFSGPVRDSAYDLARIRDLVTVLRTHTGPSAADKVKLDRISTTIDEALAKRLANTDAAFKWTARQKYEQAWVQLAEDGETYSEHLMDAVYNEGNRMLEILCMRYRYIACGASSEHLPQIAVDRSVPGFNKANDQEGPAVERPDTAIEYVGGSDTDMTLLSKLSDRSSKPDGGCTCASSQILPFGAIFLVMVARRKKRSR